MASRSLVFRFANVEVREREYALVKAGEVTSVEPKAFRVLLHLLRNPCRLVSKDELINAGWGDTAVTDNSLTRNIALLRRLLGDDPREPRYIETIATVGYRFLYQVEIWEGTSGTLTLVEDRGDDPAGSGATSTYDAKSALAPQPVSAGVGTTSEPSLLQRFFLFFGKTPYQRWEIMHLRMILWCLLVAYLGYRFIVIAPGKWGFALFFLELGCLAFLLTLLSFLVYTGVSERDELLSEVRRTAPWIRCSTVALVLVNWTMAGIAAMSHRVLAAFLVLCSTAGGVKYLLFKAAFDRRAFPEVSQK
jgi:DNA-binding winged helix-turn-helix (wHTH) protein